ncbi:MAG: hypothetical protein IKJ25_04170, partial [Clostridia bacterium]|nr:hypothetical protein [Clostridia bacterium]
ALMAKLREPEYIYLQYKSFYKLFDEIFLGIFPDFPEKVNGMLKEGKQINIKHKGSLPTEMRILAVIRLGITESRKIAEFLNTSVNTTSAYSSPLTLDLIRKNDTGKTKKVFANYRPDWTDEQWIATENIVSGIEYATIMTREDNTPLPLQIEKTLDTILYLYGVPADLRAAKIKKVLSMDYRALGHRLLSDFTEYIDKVNEI